MNKKYKSAFSHVEPSERSVERIFDMTNKKNVKIKPFLLVAAMVTLLLISLVSVNAATDGAVVQGIQSAVNTVKVFINGEEKAPEDISYEHNSEIVEGNEVDRYKFAADDGLEVEFAVGDDWVEIGANGDAGGFKAEVQDENGDTVILAVTTTGLME